MRALLIALVLAVALVGAGCGGGDEAAGDETVVTETTTDETTTDETTTDDSTTEDTETDTSGSTGNLTEDCLAAVSAFAALAQGVGAAAGGNDEDVDEAAQAFSQYADKAPDEIRDDINVLAEAYGTYIQALKDLGLQPGDIPSAEQLQQLASASEKLNTPEITAASDHFNAWATANCPSG